MFEGLEDELGLAAPPRPRPRILVVDDSRSVRELVRMHLENEGYDVVAAEDGVAAGRALLHERPDLLIVDVKLLRIVEAPAGTPRAP